MSIDYEQWVDQEFTFEEDFRATDWSDLGTRLNRLVNAGGHRGIIRAICHASDGDLFEVELPDYEDHPALIHVKIKAAMRLSTELYDRMESETLRAVRLRKSGQMEKQEPVTSSGSLLGEYDGAGEF